MTIMTTIERAENLYKQVDTFILSCVGEDGYPLTKAVVPGLHRDVLKELYFATNTSSKFAAAVTKKPKGSVYFYTREKDWEGCFLKGDFKIVTDMAEKEKYWNEEYKEAYEQQHFTDPDFFLLKFVPVEGRFYSGYALDDFRILEA